MGKKITTTQVIETVDNLTLHFLHKHIFLISHLLVAKILKAEYKSKQQSTMQYSMDGKWQNTIFSKKNNCQRQLAIHAFSSNCSQPIAMEYPQSALQDPQNFGYFPHREPWRSWEWTVSRSLKGWQIPLEPAILCSPEIPKMPGNQHAALFILKLPLSTWSGP